METKLDALIDCAPHLPPSPRLLIKLLDVFKQPDQDIHEIVRLISHDPSFAAKVLKHCNSAYFGSSKPAGDIFEAVSMIGFVEIYRIVLGMFAMSAILRPGGGVGINVEMLWRHSVAVAVAASVLAQNAGESHPAAFTAGLLHDLGKVVLVSADKEKYLQGISTASKVHSPVIVIEKVQFGFDHSEVGARLLARWNLPPNIVAAVGHHHELAGAEPHEKLSACVHLANIICHATGEKLTGSIKGLEGAEPSLAILRLTLEKVAELLPAMREELKKSKGLVPS